MSKYFNTFETQAEFDAAEIGCPSVSLVKEDNLIYYCENTCDGKTSYFDLSNQDDNTINRATAFAKSVKWIVIDEQYDDIGSTMIVPGAIKLSYAKPIAAAIETDQLMLNPLGDITTLTPISKIEFISAVFSSLPEITKEEFYKIPATLTIYTYHKDAQAHQDEMKTAFDTLWAIWERDGIEGQELAITIPNADVASITEIGNEGTFALHITSMLGWTKTTTSEIINVIRFNGQYGATLSKTENLITSEITYVYEFLA